MNSELKRAVIRESDYCCHYCNGFASTVDHKVPKAEGGSDRRDNLISCCEACNSQKGSLVPYDLFRRYVRRFGCPERGWARSTNRYKLRAISRMSDNVGVFRLDELVSERFPADCERLVRRFMATGRPAVATMLDDGRREASEAAPRLA